MYYMHKVLVNINHNITCIDTTEVVIQNKNGQVRG